MMQHYFSSMDRNNAPSSVPVSPAFPRSPRKFAAGMNVVVGEVSSSSSSSSSPTAWHESIHGREGANVSGWNYHKLPDGRGGGGGGIGNGHGETVNHLHQSLKGGFYHPFLHSLCQMMI